MEWQVKRWYNVEIHYIDLFDRCRTFTRNCENKEEREATISDYLHREDEGIIQKITAIDLHDYEIRERV